MIMPQGRQSACIPPPSDYSQHPRPPGTSRHSDRPDRGHPHKRASFQQHGFGNQPHSRLQTRFHRDPFMKYSSEEGADTTGDQSKQDHGKNKFHRNDEDDYFGAVQDEEIDDSKDDQHRDHSSEHTDDEDDPLDAYMKSLESSEGKKSTKQDIERTETHTLSSSNDKATCSSGHIPVRLDIDETDDLEESYYQFVENKRAQKSSSQDRSDYDSSDNRQDTVEYDQDGNIVAVRKIKRDVEPLPPIDHTKIQYDQFEKYFYTEHEEIQKLTPEQSEDLRKKLEIRVSGQLPPKPVCSFAHFKFEERLMKVIRRSEYVHPTPIQAQAIPAALSGRNLIGIAVTGSGKTAAYLWPMIVHIGNQPNLKAGDGPIGLILVPTRELALQVHSEAKKFSNSYKLSVICAYGGGSKFEQSKDLEMGAEIVVATPGRLIDLIKSGSTNLKRVTYLVLDEADRFFDMGFEQQVRSICDQIRPDRQTLLFSATFKYKVEQLARGVLENPIKIVQKTLGEANEDVIQHVNIFYDVNKKWDWLQEHLVEFTSAGSVLIFVTRIINSEDLQKKFDSIGKQVLLLHGDMEQAERNRVITCFKRKENDILVATDVAARGLDIPQIRTVINYDVARDVETHTHRIGRTGRAGTKGDAYTLVDAAKDKDFAGHLVKNLESANQKVDDKLLKLAMQSHSFRKSRQHKQHSSSHNHGHTSSMKDHRGASHQHHSHRHNASSSSRSYRDREQSNSNQINNRPSEHDRPRHHHSQYNDHKRPRWTQDTNK